MTLRVISTMTAMTTVALLCACGGSGVTGSGGSADSSTTTGSGTTTTGTGTGGTGTGGGVSHPLEEGNYRGLLKGTSDDTCGPIQFLPGNPVLAWTSATELTLQTPGAQTTITCTPAAGAITCAPYSVESPQGTTITLQLNSTPGAFTVLSPTQFELVEAVAVNCVGTGCAATATQGMFTFPCSVTVDELFFLWPCDAVTGGCADATEKCTLAFDAANFVSASCEAPLGSGMAGDPCTRPTNTAGADT